MGNQNSKKQVIQLKPKFYESEVINKQKRLDRFDRMNSKLALKQNLNLDITPPDSPRQTLADVRKELTTIIEKKNKENINFQ